MDANNPNPPAAPEPVAEAPATSPVPAAPLTAPQPEAGQQIVDVVAPPARTAEETAEALDASHSDQPASVATVKSKPAASSDVKMAIVATVVIVIGLAVLATMAFLKQK